MEKQLITPEMVAPYRKMVLERIRKEHLRRIPQHNGRLFLISTTYPGYWLEHTFDALAWAQLYPEDADIAASQVRFFMEHQREDGRLPCNIIDDSILEGRNEIHVFYTQLQECVSFASLCYEAWQMNPQEDLGAYYTSCCRWDEWLCRNRMTRETGLVEMFCGFDSGHDNSSRLWNMKYPTGPCREKAETLPEGYPIGCDCAPVIAPDINAVFYGSRRALAHMARELKRFDEAAAWEKKAEEVKQRLLEICFDPKTCFFYDVDKHDHKIPVKSISITSLFCEHVLEKDLADEIYVRYLANPKEFGTPYPFPSVSISDPTWQQRHKGNSWGFYSQGLVALRSLRWMDFYGRGEEMNRMMRAWISAWCREDMLRFGQELHPITGEPSECSQWYSSCMLYFLHALRRLGLEE